MLTSIIIDLERVESHLKAKTFALRVPVYFWERDTWYMKWPTNVVDPFFR